MSANPWNGCGKESGLHYCSQCGHDVEFGSCDGCGLMRHCAYCGASKDNWGPSNESLPPEHTADCPVGVALGKVKP